MPPHVAGAVLETIAVSADALAAFCRRISMIDSSAVVAVIAPWLDLALPALCGAFGFAVGWMWRDSSLERRQLANRAAYFPDHLGNP